MKEEEERKEPWKRIKVFLLSVGKKTKYIFSLFSSDFFSLPFFSCLFVCLLWMIAENGYLNKWKMKIKKISVEKLIFFFTI